MKLHGKALLVIGGAVACLIIFNTIFFLLTFPHDIPEHDEHPPPPAEGFRVASLPSFFFPLIAGLVFGAVIMLFLEKIVLSRLAKLSTTVSSIGSSGDLSARVSVKGKDEVSSLADDINGMLAKIEQTQNELRLMNEKLHVVGRLTRHDVRNKLSAVTGNIFLTKQKVSGNREALTSLDDAESAVRQVEKIFDFARTYEKLGVEELAYMNVEKTVKEAVSLFADLHGIKVVNDCRGLTVLADSLLRQLFYNLIDNSLTYGEKVGQIGVHYEKAGKEKLKLVYEDDGVGIPKAEKEKIFKEGYGKGTGYGLYLIRRICEVYGWTIEETGQHGKGAQFTITIPKINESGKENCQLN